MGLSPPSRPNISASPPTPSVAFAYCSPGATATGTRPCRTSSPAPPRGDKGAVPSTPRALPSTHRSPLAPPRSLSCPRTRHLLQIHRRARSLPLASLCHGQQAHLASPLRPQRPPSSAASTTETKRAGTPSIVEPALCFHLRPPKAAAVVLLHRASPEPAHAHLQVRGEQQRRSPFFPVVSRACRPRCRHGRTCNRRRARRRGLSRGRVRTSSPSSSCDSQGARRAHARSPLNPPCPLRSTSPSSSFGRPGPVLRAHAYAVQRRARRPARVHAVAALLNVLLLLNVTVAIWLALGILH